jgi:hypothetical protein
MIRQSRGEFSPQDLSTEDRTLVIGRYEASPAAAAKTDCSPEPSR